MPRARRPIARQRAATVVLFTSCAILIGLNTGCGQGVRWRYDFARSFEQSQASNRLTLVYFRQWFLPLCAKVEEKVFGTPELREATRDVTCVRYELFSGDPLSAAWGVKAAPAYVIVDTDGRILTRGTGEFTAAEVTDALTKARAAMFGAAPRPAGTP